MCNQPITIDQQEWIYFSGGSKWLADLQFLEVFAGRLAAPLDLRRTTHVLYVYT